MRLAVCPVLTASMYRSLDGKLSSSCWFFSFDIHSSSINTDVTFEGLPVADNGVNLGYVLSSMSPASQVRKPGSAIHKLTETESLLQSIPVEAVAKQSDVPRSLGYAYISSVPSRPFHSSSKHLSSCHRLGPVYHTVNIGIR